MDTKISWELYRSFLAVMQFGSLSAAARELGSTQPTIGRHIAALEQHLGIVLFTRAQGGLVASKEAQSLLPYAQQIGTTVAALNRVASCQSSHIQGVVRITASDIIGIELLPPIFSKLRAKHAMLKLELTLSDQPLDLLHRQADIAVRMFRPTQQQLIARKVGNVSIGLYASQDYAQSHKLPVALEQLSEHALIGYDHITPFIRETTKKLNSNVFERTNFSLAADSNVAQLAMIKAGMGIGACQTQLAQRYQLIPILADSFCVNLELWIVMHEDLRYNKACRAVFDALCEGLKR
ncbi:LysR family transcriptional regulator [Celerinatantimonas sp. MCCC 1A17872]|uniref:LysR family transcriptional regulator n=1 Tax=Celerinatantimonas sp. MCCC 1A17872 TaxID=3177514 RepID=UPI0038C9FEA2